MKKTTLLFLTILTIGLSYGQNQHVVKYVRKNASSPEAQADLKAMKIALEKMREMKCENGLSWYYQGAIHNIPNEINGKNKLCPEYQTSKDKLFAWGNCTHINTEAAQLHFLLWHRMYIWYFEQIVRELSGKQDFALPYWNYGQDNIMPEKIRQKGSSLFESARYTILNQGQSIPKDKAATIRLSIQELKNNPIFVSDAGFSKMMEINPHGFMHDLIGGTYAEPKPELFFNQIYQKEESGLMALVPSAGFDPVFWLHHSMVDRIWESWDRLPGKPRPTLKELEAYPWEYNFIKPNGEQITYTVKEMYDIIFNLGYTYDSFLYTSDTPPLFASNNLSKEQKIPIQDSKGEIVWEQKVGKIIKGVAFSHKVNNKFTRRTNRILKSDSTKPHLILNLSVVTYKEPDDYYNVFLRYPDKEDEYVGSMTFFGVAHDHGTGENHTIGESGVNLNFSYFITDDLIHSAKNFEVIIKKNGAGNAKITLEKISISKLN
ncbi:tyrosinase family protein [Tenacibaculum xiamenense]|uniref:tyrosinase family protein n=1 Tax=Tenacibaculum xiamenense TaxID=1261553 RepID=UPI0038965357